MPKFDVYSMASKHVVIREIRGPGNVRMHHIPGIADYIVRDVFGKAMLGRIEHRRGYTIEDAQAVCDWLNEPERQRMQLHPWDWHNRYNRLVAMLRREATVAWPWQPLPGLHVRGPHRLDYTAADWQHCISAFSDYLLDLDPSNEIDRSDQP